MSRKRIVLILASLPLAARLSAQPTDLGLIPFQAQTAWPAVHRDARNSDFSPFIAPAENRLAWRALEGAAVLPAPLQGPEGNLYVTSGRGQGFRHLHAFDREGRLLWESEPQATLDDFDAWAAFSAPVIGRDGTVYASDANQLWAFGADGDVQWSADLPGDKGFASVVVTNEGFVGGVTLDGQAAFYRREDGVLARPVLDLPGGPGPPAAPMPPGAWQGLLDPEVAQDAFQLFLGRVFEVTNTPAIHPDTGRIYVVGAGPTPEAGTLYGLDLVENAITIAFESPMGGGSGASPAVSDDGQRVYAVDSAGRMTAFDAETGQALWEAEGANANSSPAVGPDETIYTGGRSLTALDPADGSLQWSRGFGDLASSILPELPPAPPVFLTGIPVGQTNGVIAVSATKVHAALAFGYEYTDPATGVELLQPRVTALAAFSPEDGALLGLTVLPDTNEGPVSVSSSGRIYTPHAGLLSSIFYYGANQLLPPDLQTEPPAAGLSALAPISFRTLAIEGAVWPRDLCTQALTDLEERRDSQAFLAARRALAQASATIQAIAEAAGEGELSVAGAGLAAQRATQARSHLFAARVILGLAAPFDLYRAAAAGQLELARSELNETLAVLAD